MDTTVIKNLGLTDYETTLFLCLLKNGPLSVYELATKTGLYRQACYDALNRLQEKGFVSYVLQNGRKIFTAINPAQISLLLEQQKSSFDALLPELLALKTLGGEDITVSVFKGKTVIPTALRDIISTLPKNGEVLCTAVDELFALETNKTIVEQYERDILLKKIHERVIIKKGTRGFLQKGNTQYRYIDAQYFNANPVLIYGDTVEIIMWGSPNHLIQIKSKPIAESFRKQFEFMWLHAKK